MYFKKTRAHYFTTFICPQYRQNKTNYTMDVETSKTNYDIEHLASTL